MSTDVRPKAMIAMSGGVDSSVAALLAMRMGYDCVGVTMKLYEDIKGAEDVAKTLGIEHRVVDFSDEFRKRVIEPFVCSYESGETPNPCVICNKAIKFGLLYDYAREEGFSKLVTGHYAKVESGCRLARAKDHSKDQSYFLYCLTPEKLEHILFPLGELTKQEVRAIAEEAGLANASKSDSQDICFLPDGKHAEFIAKYRGTSLSKGNFVDSDGHVIGRHNGIERYTIGQRKGLGVALGRPVFVKEIRPETGEVVLADEKEVFAKRIEIADINWLSEKPDRAEVMIRYNTKPVGAKLSHIAEEKVCAEFDEPVRAPAKGQAAVLYKGDIVLGGGRIAK